MEKGPLVRSLQIMHLALLIGAAFFLPVLMLVRNYGRPVSMGDEAKIFDYLGVLAPLLGIVFSAILYNARLKSLYTTDSLKAKIDLYRSAFVLRMAILQGPIFFSVITTYLTGTYYVLILPVLAWFYMLSLKPTTDKIAADLQLSANETDQLREMQITA